MHKHLRPGPPCGSKRPRQRYYCIRYIALQLSWPCRPCKWNVAHTHTYIQSNIDETESVHVQSKIYLSSLWIKISGIFRALQIRVPSKKIPRLLRVISIKTLRLKYATNLFTGYFYFYHAYLLRRVVLAAMLQLVWHFKYSSMAIYMENYSRATAVMDSATRV